MTYEEKLDRIIKAINEAKKLTRKRYYPKLYYTTDNGLKEISLSEIHDILLQLQDDEKVITIKDIPTALKTPLQLSTDVFEGDKNYFLIDILDTFEDWHEKYLLEHKSKLQNLDWINLLKIYDVMLDINEQIQIRKSATVLIPVLPQLVKFPALFPADDIGMRDKYKGYRWDGVDYLKKNGIVSDFTFIENYAYGDLDITVKLSNFEDFLKEISKEYIKRGKAVPQTNKSKETTTEKPSNQPITKIDIVYEITYTKQRQILMNNTQIGKPDFNSENDLVFSYLYEHPNESFTKEQIEKAIGVKLNKSLHKIVENLGFEGDTKEAFISVSKNAILFRNPITKQDLDKMKKPTIKLVKGGGKLILPH